MSAADDGSTEANIYLIAPPKEQLDANKSGRYLLMVYFDCDILVLEVGYVLKMIKGCRIHNPAMLYEGYEQIDSGFVANVDADKIQSLFENFVKLHNEPCFVILEVPTNVKEETTFLLNGTSPLHKDVYYIDGLTPARAVEFLNVFGEWLIHDGLSSFGIGIHSGANEIVTGKYNVVTVYTRDKQKYDGFFETLGIRQASDLKTAWDYFNSDAPGDSFLYTYKGKNIYDLIEHLKQYGLYFAERRED